jgi:hypothetical protein
MHFRPVGMPKDAGYLFPHKVRQIRAYATPSFLQPRQRDGHVKTPVQRVKEVKVLHLR